MFDPLTLATGLKEGNSMADVSWTAHISYLEDELMNLAERVGKL